MRACRRRRPPRRAKPRALAVENVTEDKFTGDFDRMFERRRIRVLVPYSRTLYFNDKGTQRGVTADLMREFEQHLNRKYAKQTGKRPITLVMIPTTRDEMFDDVAAGLADIAAGNLSITESRLKKVDFAYLPDLPGMNEVIATGPKSPALTSIDDLAGKTIHMRKVESYRETIEQLSQRFVREGKAPIGSSICPTRSRTRTSSRCWAWACSSSWWWTTGRERSGRRS